MRWEGEPPAIALTAACRTDAVEGVAEDLAGRHAKGARGADRVGSRVTYAGVRVPEDRVERVEEQRHQRRHHSDAEQGDHERQERDSRDGLQDAYAPDDALGPAAAPLERQAKRHRERDRAGK